jgi:hypothetical protein
MAATVSSVLCTEMPNGERQVRGTATIGVYTTGGVTCDISAYISGTPSEVMVESSGGYVFEHDGGTSAAGVIEAYYANGGASGGAALVQVANATNLSAVTTRFTAYGVAV